MLYSILTFGFDPSVLVALVASQVITRFVSPAYQVAPTAGEEMLLIAGRTPKAAVVVSVKDVPVGGLTLLTRILKVSATLEGATQTGDSETDPSAPDGKLGSIMTVSAPAPKLPLGEYSTFKFPMTPVLFQVIGMLSPIV